MTCFGYEPGNFSFLKPSNFRQQSLSGQRKFKARYKKTGSNLIITMGKALLGKELLLSKKILVVEDSCDLRELLGMVLASRGWDPILAESGRKALTY